jgi:glyoxylase-like metal-dependent hydrolase (beta-lactamase superfamily II)
MMELIEIKKDIYVCLQEDKGFGWNNSGFINLGGGLVIDTLYDVNHTKQMLKLYNGVSNEPMQKLVNTHHNGDHTWGNQLFKDGEIIAHRYCAEEMEKEKNRNLPGLLQTAIKKPNRFPPGMKWFIDDISEFKFSDVEITLPNHLIEERFDLELDGHPCQLIYVGPAHTSGDLIVYLPDQGIIFSGDIVFWKSTPLGWEGTHAKWIDALDLIISLDPEVIVPGHGPLCDVEGVKKVQDYFNLVYTESKKFFEEGLDILEASKRIDLGPYAEWTEPERLIFNIKRAYREFRDVEPWNAPFNEIELISKGSELRAYWDKS